jgi:SAM-dependent methyltransferase
MTPEVLARDNVLVLQADLREAPVRLGQFDVVYCHRVIQHTPDPKAAFASIARYVRPGGILFLHSYDTHWKSILHYRYWLRPMIRRLPHPTINRMLRIAGPVLYPVAGALNRVAILRRPTKLLVPFDNHNRILQKAGAKLSARERYDYSFLITFDALTPQHDHPSSPATVEGWFRDQGFVDVVIRSRNPVIATGRRPG